MSFLRDILKSQEQGVI